MKLHHLILSLQVAGCGGSDSGSTGSSDTSDAATHHHDSEGASTGHHHDSEGASTGHVHETGSETHAHSEGGTTGEPSPAAAYCACMLERCHDLYHATWGEDHEQSEAMCMAAAEAVPSVGMPATSGDSIECRQHFCAMGHDVAGACEAALGAAPCAD